MDRELMFLTGLPRSGITWLADIIGSHSSINYLTGEVFNPGTTLSTFGLKGVPWFINEDKLKPGLVHETQKALLLNKNFDFFMVRLFRLLQSGNLNWKDYARIVKHLGYSLNAKAVFTKDPIALFFVPYMIREFSAKMVIIKRNPYRFIGSMKRMNWFLGFSYLPLSYQHKYAADIASYSKLYPQGDVVTNTLIWWRISEQYFSDLRAMNLSFLIVEHDALVLNIQEEIMKVLGFYNLSIDKNVQSKIDFYQEQKEHKGREHRQTHNLERSANEVMNQWKVQLTDEDINLIEQSINEPPPRLL